MCPTIDSRSEAVRHPASRCLGRFTGLSRGRSPGNCGYESNRFGYSYEPGGAILLRSCAPPSGIASVSVAVREIAPTKAARQANGNPRFSLRGAVKVSGGHTLGSALVMASSHCGV